MHSRFYVNHDEPVKIGSLYPVSTINGVYDVEVEGIALEGTKKAITGRVVNLRGSNEYGDPVTWREADPQVQEVWQ